MSKSTRITPEQLRLMNLEEVEPGVYKKKKTKIDKAVELADTINIATAKLQNMFNKGLNKDDTDIPETEYKMASNECVAGIDPASDEPSQAAVVKRWADGTAESVNVDGIPRLDLIEEMRQISKHYNTSIAYESIRLTVLGEPTPQQRHRHHQVKGSDFVTTYDPSSKAKKEFLKACLPHKPKSPYEQPLCVDMVFYFSRPKSHYRSGKYAHLLKDNAPEYHITRPDSDNLAKLVKDALNKVFWKDDSLVCDLNIKKRYDHDNPRTEITIRKL